MASFYTKEWDVIKGGKNKKPNELGFLTKFFKNLLCW
jgi:hypothetical protein